MTYLYVKVKDRNSVTWEIVSVETGNNDLICAQFIFWKKNPKTNGATSVVFQI